MGRFRGVDQKKVGPAKMNLSSRAALARILSAAAMFVSLSLPATVFCGVTAQVHNNLSSSVGSSDDYVREQHLGRIRKVPELGLEVAEGTGRLATGRCLRGIRVIRVIPEGPAAQAGLRSEETLGKSALAGAFLAGGLLFPPALFVGLVIASSDIGDSHDTIIALDAERTSDVRELENAIGRSRKGPIVYLSVIRGGKRNQIRILLPTARGDTE
jgi:hypothetical protein